MQVLAFAGNMPAMAAGSTLLTLGVGNPLDVTGRGSLIPTTSVDQYAATLAQWLGVAPASLPSVLPNINNFTVQKLGFMG